MPGSTASWPLQPVLPRPPLGALSPGDSANGPVRALVQRADGLRLGARGAG